MKTQTKWVPKEGDPIYYKDGKGNTIPGEVVKIFWVRENEVHDFPPTIKT